ncbi:hypothetical protein SAMN07250955_11552 [Arboricoccus pini]|uniref:Uncharacterized protein n=1 Tax=Arboricoccus pini TaxID=1963835 RepID=A0A212RV95_9PROT|nr:hypothetical protein [Arboricoccus pini]SNB76654.1 hypothetical protein SAMN07250955_11552 [Arboricoccus pini]
MAAATGDPSIEGGRVSQVGPCDVGMRDVRTCFDHLPGRVSGATTDAMRTPAFIGLKDDGGILAEAGMLP